MKTTRCDWKACPEPKRSDELNSPIRNLRAKLEPRCDNTPFVNPVDVTAACDAPITIAVGPYLVHTGKDKLLGRGTFGNVFEGEDKDGYKYAIKRECKEMDGNDISTFIEREISLLRRLCPHKNIVQFHSAHDDGYFIYLVFELCWGGDLKNCLETRYKNDMPIETIRACMWQIFEGLRHCHARGVMHRDLKPQNILVQDTPLADAVVIEDGSIGNACIALPVLKIADFGSSRCVDDTADGRCYTLECCTLWYKAPEILLGSPYYQYSADMWSAGCIFWELVTGNSLFPGIDTDHNQLVTIFKRLGTPTEKIWPGVTKLPCAYIITGNKQLSMPLIHAKLDDTASHLMNYCLRYNPSARLTAHDALFHRWFR